MVSHIVTQESCNNPLKAFYECQVNEKQKSPQIARHNVTRRLVVLVYGVLKTGEKFDPYRRRKNIEEKS